MNNVFKIVYSSQSVRLAAVIAAVVLFAAQQSWASGQQPQLPLLIQDLAARAKPLTPVVAAVPPATAQASGSALPPPLLIAPVPDHRFGPEDSPAVLEWYAIPEVETYAVAFSLSSDFAGHAAILETRYALFDLGWLLTMNDWSPVSAVIYWRVAGIATDGARGEWSEIRWFNKSAAAAPRGPWPDMIWNLPALEPPPGLVWEPALYAVSYELQFLTADDARTPLATLETMDNRYVFDLPDMEPWYDAWGALRWRVSARDANGVPGPWSYDVRFAKNGRGRIACMGDSITYGLCHEATWGYQAYLQEWLTEAWGLPVTLFNEGIPGAKTVDGKLHIADVMLRDFPEFVLIMYGTNDSVDPFGCTWYGEPYGCLVYENMEATAVGALIGGATPYLATIPLTNPEGQFAWAGRVETNSDLLRELARDLNIPLVDINRHFWAYSGHLPSLYCDALHLTELGYRYLAQGWLASLR